MRISKAAGQRVRCPDPVGVRNRPRGVQIVGVGAFDLHRDDLADTQRTTACDVNAAVDFGRVALAASLGDGRATSSMMTCWRVPTFFFRRRAEMICWRSMKRFQRSVLSSSGTGLSSRVRRRSGDRLYLKQPARSISASSIQSSNCSNSASVSRGKPTMNVERSVRSGQISRQRAIRFSVFSCAAGRFMRASTLGLPCWKGYRDRAAPCVGHQRDDLIDMRVGVDVVQPHPCAEFAEFAGEIEEACINLAVVEFACGVFDIHAVGRRVLRDDQHSLVPAFTSFSASRSTSAMGRGDEIAAQLRNDAERAAMIAAFGNLQIGVVARRELDALRRQKIEVRVVFAAERHDAASSPLSYCCGSRDRQHTGIGLFDRFGLGAHAPGDDDLAVLSHRIADRGERFILGAVEKSRRC